EQPPSVMSDQSIAVYINWDGFANYYIEIAEKQNKIPTLSWIKNTAGVFFPNAFTSIPSITNPMQVAIASGTTPRYTDNHYRYFNKKLNMVIQEDPPRKNEAETLAEAANRQNLEVISINQFAFLNRGTVVGEPTKAYINTPENLGGHSDAAARFDEAINLIKNQQSGNISFKRIPRFIALYMDDLDGIGHNETSKFGLGMAPTELVRQQAVVDRLALMDRKLGEFIQTCQAAGIYEQMSFVLTADHGMASFGSQQPENTEGKQTKLFELIAAIESLGAGFKCEVLHPNNGTKTPAADTDIAVVTVGLQVQLSYIGQFDSNVIRSKNEKIIAVLKDQPYIGKIMGREELTARGVKSGFADLVISPQIPYHFHLSVLKSMTARGQHDSLADAAQRVAAFMWGRGVKAGYTYQAPVFNYDFIPTIAKLLNINPPLDATGNVLYDALSGPVAVAENSVKLEDDQAVLAGATFRYNDLLASGGTVCNLYGRQSALEFSNVPATTKMVIQYAAVDNGKLALYVNNQLVRDVFFPETSGSVAKYDQKTINLSLSEGDVIKFVNDDARGGIGVEIDAITFLMPLNSVLPVDN
ncbi:MAG TPA: alkaline phosphatase family protein, partial [Bacillota bacterium]|nr:alkaline phosphatase family protein [Bacillota bacterium]